MYDSSEIVLVIGRSGICIYIYKRMRKVFYLILTGIAIGVLLAPGKGSATWEKMADYLDILKNKAKNTFNDLKDGVMGMAEKAKSGVEKASGEW